MSKSRKKNPVVWCTGRSNKAGKRQANKRFRRIVHQRINSDYPIPMYVKEITDFWCMPADGKMRLEPNDEYYEKSLRK